MVDVFTIGYGNRPIDAFVALLLENGVRVVFDVRSIPKSAYHPDFNWDGPLRDVLTAHGIGLQHTPDLGGRQNRDHPDVKLQVTRALEEIRRRKVSGKGMPLCLMCSESDPSDCHRAEWIAPGLVDIGVSVMHIGKDGKLLTQAQVDAQAKSGQGVLFESKGEPSDEDEEDDDYEEEPTGLTPKQKENQRVRVAAAMADGKEWTKYELAEVCGMEAGSVTSRIRDLREDKYGGYTIETNKKDPLIINGVRVYRYQVDPKDVDRLRALGDTPID